MKTLLISNSFWNFFNFRKNLVFELTKKNKIYLVANKDKFENKFIHRNIKTIQSSLNKNKINILSDFKYLLFILKVFKKIKPDIIVSFTFKPNLISLLVSRLLKIKTIITISGLGTLFLNHKVLFYLILKIFKILINEKVTIFFHNKDDFLIFKKKKIIDNVFKVAVINGSGVDFKKFKFTKKNFKKDKFIFVGRLIKEKGINELLAVIQKIKKKLPNSKFKIIGEFDKNNPRSIEIIKLKNFVKSGMVSYENFKTNIQNEYKNSTCLILPSYREGLSKTIMEAMYSGLPVITYDVPGCKDIVNKSKGGLLAKFRNNASLEKQILKFASLSISKKSDMSINAHNYAKKNFDEKKILSKYINEIQKR